jgi:hypothetical protein
MTITMLATLCHMATVGPGVPAIEFCQEQVVARAESSEESCYMMAQQIIAPRLMPGFTVRGIRCATDKDGKDRPRDAI